MVGGVVALVDGMVALVDGMVALVGGMVALVGGMVALVDGMVALVGGCSRGSGVRSVLLHSCSKISTFLRSLPVWLTHSMTDSPSRFLVIRAKANPHLLQFTGSSRHLLLTLLRSFKHCGTSSHIPTALPQMVSMERQ